MNPTQAAARKAGILYFLFAIVAIIGEFFFPSFVVLGDAEATARNITAGEPTYRLSILTGFLTLILFIFLVAGLYRLLKRVDKKQAMLMALLASTGIAVALANMIHKFVPLVLLSGSDYLSVFSKDQLDALALGFLRLHSSGSAVVTAFWGLWLFPFGILVIKSRMFPRILGYLLIVAGCAYVAGSVTTIVLPAHRQIVNKIMMPLYFGEVPIILWLLIMGAREPHALTGRGSPDGETLEGRGERM